MRLACTVLILGLTGAFLSVGAAPNDWAEGTADRDDGATREYYNHAAYLKWINNMGDWHDAKNKSQGETPYSVAKIAKGQKAQFVEWDVTALVHEWHNGAFQNQGFFLRLIDGKGDFQFASREADDEKRPLLSAVRSPLNRRSTALVGLCLGCTIDSR